MTPITTAALPGHSLHYLRRGKISGFDFEVIPQMNNPSALADKLHSLGSATQLPKGTFIFGQGDPAKGVYMIDKGQASVSLAGEDGIPRWSRVVGSGAILGLPSSISGEPYTLSAVALENVDATFVSRSAVCELMASDVSIAAQIVSLLSDELADLRRKVSLLKSGVPQFAGS